MQLLAKFEKILYMEFRATLKFENLSLLDVVPFLNYKPLKL